MGFEWTPEKLAELQKEIEKLQPSGLCVKCNERPATIWWCNNPYRDFIHGGKEARCEICCLKEQIKIAKEMSANLPELEDKLKKLQNNEQS